MKNIKGIILDIDGCIVGEKIGFNSPEPNIEVIRKLKYLRESGIPIILCTAKPQFSVWSIIDACKLNNYHITDAGGVLINPIDNEIVKKYTIDTKDAQKVLSMCLENNIYTEIYTTDDYYIQKNQVCEITNKHKHILQKEAKVVGNLINQSQKLEITKIMPVALDYKDKERVISLFENLGTKLSLSWGVHPVALPLQFAIVTAEGISKKQGAIDIAQKLNISFENALGIGDSTSDWKFMSMCKYAGAMGNASEELKELVKTKGGNFGFIGGHVDENGILEILNKIEL